MSTPSCIPDPDVSTLPQFARCGLCGGTWDSDATVICTEKSEPDIPLSEFAGQPLEDARQTRALRGQQGGVLYGLSPFVQSKDDAIYKEVEWNYIIQDGDKGFALVTTYYHPECSEDEPERS